MTKVPKDDDTTPFNVMGARGTIDHLVGWALWCHDFHKSLYKHIDEVDWEDGDD